MKTENDLFDIIEADPPWQFKDYSNHPNGAINNGTRLPSAHYPTMDIQDIYNLKIPAKKDAVLFLWAVWPLLPEALKVIDAWGFEYKSLAWVWVKSNKNGMGFFTGMGYRTRANSEPCLLATRGKSIPVASHSIQALIYSPVRKHSQKPEERYRKIEALYPGLKYLEMFSRRKRPGWSSWGNEIESDIQIERG